MTTNRSITLRVQLLKEHIDDFHQALVEGTVGRCKAYELRADLPFEGCLYITKPSDKPPPWFEFAKDGLKDSLDELRNRTNAAVLIIRRSGRHFAFPFGSGRYLIDDSAVEPTFGLRASLNALEPDSLRSTDSMNFDDQTIHTRTQTSRVAGIEAFGLNVNRDILRSVTGRAKQDSIFTRVTGTEATLAFSARIKFGDLGKLCDHLLTLHKLKDYQNHFPWVDNIRRITDPPTIKELDELLLRDLTNDPKAYLAPPEPIEWEDFDGFSYTRQVQPTTDPDINDYMATLGAENASIEKLKRDRVFLHEPGGKRKPAWNVYKCIVFETDFQDTHYVLSNGQWFKVDETFAQRIQQEIANIPQSPLQLPFVHRLEDGKLEDEGDYNRRVTHVNPSIALIDGTRAYVEGASTPIEPCDLLTEKSRFVHVKHRRGGSSALSHLFAQARISCDAFMTDDKFREKLRAVLEQQHPNWVNRIPSGTPQPADYPVVIAILGMGTADLQGSRGLPFFSQLNLVHTVEFLQGRGFKVELLGIDVGDELEPQEEAETQPIAVLG